MSRAPVASFPIPAVVDNLTRLRDEVSAAVAAGEVAELREYLADVPDPRDCRGMRHTLTSTLLVTACAVVAGACSFTAIGEWAADAPQRKHAQYLLDRGADYVLTVKANQPGLSARLDELARNDIDVHTTHNTGHGRSERRTNLL